MLSRSAFASRHKNAGRPAEKRAPRYLQWLRGRRCFLHDKGGCAGKMEAAHVDHAGGKGIGTKVADKFAVPMCSHHHSESHRIGRNTFEARHRINLLAAAEAYWRAWPGRIQYERQLEGSR